MAAAACIVTKALNPNVKVIGVQAENAPTVYLPGRTGSSWKPNLPKRSGKV